MIGEYLSDFHGLPVVDYAAGNPSANTPDRVAWRLSVPTFDAEDQWPEFFAKFLDSVDPASVAALVIGTWNEPHDQSSADVVSALVAAAPRLTALRAVFVGDMTYEDCEISWIVQSDLTPILTAYPNLEELGIRGGNQLELQSGRHDNLRRLVIQSGGLPAEVVRTVGAFDFPALTDLELWLGIEDYGGDTAIEDVAPILAGDRLPALTRLALRNSYIEDRIATAVATAPITPRLTELDLSMGVLTDIGGRALLTSAALGNLRSLNLQHNYLSDEVRQQLAAHLKRSGIQADLDTGDADEDEYDGTVYRSVAVGE